MTIMRMSLMTMYCPTELMSLMSQLFVSGQEPTSKWKIQKTPSETIPDLLHSYSMKLFTVAKPCTTITTVVTINDNNH